MYNTIIIGAGQAGLATAYHLQQQNIQFLILEGSNQTAGSWPNYYKSLKVFSPVAYSHLPGFQFPGEKTKYPSREDVIDYLEAYARHFDFPVETDATVVAVARKNEGFVVTTVSGRNYETQTVVDATGAFNRPYFPELPNASAYTGEVLHTFGYKVPQGFEHKRVLVIGGGNSAIQVAGDLVGTAQSVTLTTRSSLKLIPQKILGLDVHFYSRYFGLDKLRPRDAEVGGKQPVQVIDTGNYRAMLASGAIRKMPMFAAFTETGVRWQDGATEAFDVVIYGTGYRPNYAHLPSEALSNEGRLLQHKGISEVAGLYFVGQAFQRNFASATLRGVGSDAAYVVKHLKRQLQNVRSNV